MRKAYTMLCATEHKQLYHDTIAAIYNKEYDLFDNYQREIL
jgi:hypothetical protein